MENVVVKIKEHLIEIQMKSEPLTKQTEHNGQKPYKCILYEKSLLLDIILLFMKSCSLVRSCINVVIVKSALLKHAILKITRECTLVKKHLNAGIVKRALL